MQKRNGALGFFCAAFLSIRKSNKEYYEEEMRNEKEQNVEDAYSFRSCGGNDLWYDRRAERQRR